MQTVFPRYTCEDCGYSTIIPGRVIPYQSKPDWDEKTMACGDCRVNRARRTKEHFDGMYSQPGLYEVSFGYSVAILVGVTMVAIYLLVNYIESGWR